MQIIEKITKEELRKIADRTFGDMVKAVVDIAKKTVMIDAELHADIEQTMLENGSNQEDLWGINIYPDGFDDNGVVEFDSLINIRPWQNNRSRYVNDENIRKQIVEIVENKITE
jgi:hypothetical protein